MNEKIQQVTNEVKKVIKGKDEVIGQVLCAILANGHILFDDIPGVGKTTLATALSKALGIKYNRVQFTPDVLPSDIVGFSVYNKNSGFFEYVKGAPIGTNLLLGDEINRTSSKTQSALLEAMEERQVTVDGNTYALEKPFIVIATQNNVGTAGTQLLPYAQLDRFLVRLSIGYPDFESQLEIITERQTENPIDSVETVLTVDELVKLQEQAVLVNADIKIVKYITSLTFATRESEDIELGISPRGAIAVNNMAKANAFINGRDYVIPEDVKHVFKAVCAHRIILSQRARLAGVTQEKALDDILNKVSIPTE